MNYFNNEKFKIADICVNNYSFIRIIPQVNYMQIWDKFHNIPTEKECRVKDYWITEEDCEITIHLKSGKVLKYAIKKGHVTDFASVPKMLWGVISNDDVAIIVPAIIHDINFGTHELSFKDSNTLFNECMRFYKMEWFYRVAAYKAVSWCSKSHYQAKPSEINKTKRLVSFEWNLVE